MKKLILAMAILLVAASAYAAPFLVSDPQANTETYEITGAIAAVVAAQPDGSLRYDLSAIPAGSYSIQVAACVGVWCSPTSPFGFTKPSLNAPVNIRLVK